MHRLLLANRNSSVRRRYAGSSATAVMNVTCKVQPHSGLATVWLGDFDARGCITNP